MAEGASPVKASCAPGRCSAKPLPAMSKSDAEREKRLAEALRQNLRRRKAQARESAEPAASDREQDRENQA